MNRPHLPPVRRVFHFLDRAFPGLLRRTAGGPDRPDPCDQRLGHERVRTVFPHCSHGFSLLELLVVLLVLGLLVGAVAQPLSTVLDQNRFDKTEHTVRDLVRAVLGDPGARDGGMFNGFVADMGTIPVVADHVRAQDGVGAWHFYRCIRPHTSADVNHPATGAEGALYWTEDHRVPFDPANTTLDWAAGQDYECTVEPSLLWDGKTLVNDDADTRTFRCLRMHRSRQGINRPPGCAGSPAGGDPLWSHFWVETAHVSGTAALVADAVYVPERIFHEADVVSHDDGSGNLHRYRCIRSHVSELLTNEPAGGAGSAWLDYWTDEGAVAGGETPWAAGREYSRETRIACGWHGPYLAAPPGGVLRDGWGNPLHFDVDQDSMDAQTDKGRLRIVSHGADGLDDASAAPCEPFDADRSWVVEPAEWQGVLTAQVDISVTNRTGSALTQDATAVLSLHCPVWGLAGTLEAASETLATTGMPDGGTRNFVLPATDPFVFHGVTATGPGADVTNTRGSAFPLADDPAIGLCALSVVIVYDDSGGSGTVSQKERVFPVMIGTGGNFAADLSWDVSLD